MNQSPKSPARHHPLLCCLEPALASALLLSACHGSVQADAKVGGDADSAAIKEFDRPLDEAAAKLPEAQADETGSQTHALLGARHDLNYNGPKAATCQCLAVSLSDHPDDGAFQWEMSPPDLDSSSQWVIALSSNGVPCSEPTQGTLGASYQGYVMEGNDVVVYVEALGEGRPMTSGAIIPKPNGTGGVFIESAGASYGKPADGKGKRCKIAPAGAASVSK